MAELKISGRMIVSTLRKQFKDQFGLDLRVYKGTVFADDKATLASISDKKIEEFGVNGHLIVGNFETYFENATGLKVQVATLPDAKVEPNKLVNNSFTISEASKKFGPK